jgi:hypothetical protein
MRRSPPFLCLVLTGIFSAALLRADEAKPSDLTPSDPDAAMLRRIYDAALTGSPAYAQLGELTAQFPGRLSGSKNLEGAVQWAKAILDRMGLDRTGLQPVKVPHWERGAPELVQYRNTENAQPIGLTATALGGSVPTPARGLSAPVIELHALAELKTADARGKIVFFNRPMNPALIIPGQAYGEAGDQRFRGPAEAAKCGAVGVRPRSRTQALDDLPHTGTTTYLPEVPRIPAAALSTVAANRLSTALAASPNLTVEMRIHSQWLEDAQSDNVIGELRGTESPDKIILVGGHLDSWDITPGAHDDGAGVVQSVEVLRLLQAAGYRPRHTIRCVLFVNEENGLRGGVEYARVTGDKKEEHLLALETDSGGFQPRGFQLGNTAGNAAARAARWQGLFEPYGNLVFRSGSGGADVGPLMAKGYAVGELLTESQRYFDIHHTRADTIDKVNPRELQLGAAALAALVYLVDQHGL